MGGRSPLHGDITHVSDTALMVAACRALESESSDGLVRDPLALQLAGLRGMEILRALPDPHVMTFSIGVRSRFIDELLIEALASNPIAAVINVGCGLDTRPWRLELTPDLRWIEVDFADVLDYKDAVLSQETPRCRRERFAADVNDAAQRRALFAAAGTAAALMITEGLLTYLPAETVRALAAESSRHSGVTQWISDINTGAFAKATNRDLPQSVRNVRASDFLEGEQILDHIRRYDWRTEARRSYVTDLAFAKERIQRLFGYSQRPDGPPITSEDPSGVHRFVRE